jgi:hypothetical protein
MEGLSPQNLNRSERRSSTQRGPCSLSVSRMAEMRRIHHAADWARMKIRTDEATLAKGDINKALRTR